MAAASSLAVAACNWSGEFGVRYAFFCTQDGIGATITQCC